MYSFELEYTLIDCEKCGQESTVLGECPGCGTQSGDRDPHLDARIKALDRIRRAAGSTERQLDMLDLDRAWDVFSLWLDRFLEPLAKLASDPSDEGASSDIGTAVGSLAAMKLALDATPHLRPATAFWRVLVQIADALSQATNSYFGAFVADTTQEAQAEAAAAQGALDEAASLAGRADALMKRLNLAEDSSPLPERLAALASRTFADIGAESLLDFESAGVEIFKRIASGHECPTGLGAGLHLTWAHVEASLDAERFIAVTRRTFDLLASSTPALVGLIANDDWRSAFSSASQEMFDAVLEVEAAIEGAQSIERLEVRAAIRLAALLVERVAQVMLATLACVQGRRDWRSVRSRDVNSLLNEARDAAFDDLLFGIDIALRDADAHGEYRIMPSGVEFTSSRREYDSLTLERLVDRVFGTLESCLALTPP